MIKETERVFVRTKSFEGMATVLHIIKNEFYPVQVELDQPDSDGHKITRVAFHEIVKHSAAYKKEVSAPTEKLNNQEQLQQMSFLDFV